MSTLQDNPTRTMETARTIVPPADARRWTARTLVPFLPAALALAAALYLPVHWCAGRWTDLDSPQSYQPLVPLGAAWLAWQRKEQVRAAWTHAGGPKASGVGNVALLLTGGLLIVAAHVLQLGLLGIAGGAVVLAGAVLCVGGWAVTRALAVPLLFLLLTVPVPNSVLGPATQHLQMDCTRAAGNVLANLGVPCRVGGNLLFLHHFQLEVIAPCAGVGMVAPVLALTLWRLLGRTKMAPPAPQKAPPAPNNGGAGLVYAPPAMGVTTSLVPPLSGVRGPLTPPELGAGGGIRALLTLAAAGAVALGFNVLRITSVGLIGAASPSLARTLHDPIGWLWTAAAFGVAFFLTRPRKVAP